jgi:hypothetical protein
MPHSNPAMRLLGITRPEPDYANVGEAVATAPSAARLLPAVSAAE